CCFYRERKIYGIFSYMVFTFFHNKTTTNGVISFRNIFTILKTCKQCHSIRVERKIFGKKKLQIFPHNEAKIFFTCNINLPVLYYMINIFIKNIYIKTYRIFTRKTEHYGNISTMSNTCFSK